MTVGLWVTYIMTLSMNDQSTDVDSSMTQNEVSSGERPRIRLGEEILDDEPPASCTR